MSRLDIPCCSAGEVTACLPVVHWLEATFHLIDFEGSVETGVIEYGVVTVCRGAIVDTATRLCGGRGPIRREDVAVHGITAGAVRHLEPFDCEWERFVGLRAGGVFGAHHAPIENAMLRSTWLHPPASPDWLHENRTIADWGPWVDTRQLYQSIYPDLPSHALEPLIGQFRLGDILDREADKYCPNDRRHFHCALYDALASALLLIRLGSLDGFLGLTVHWLLQHSAPSAKERQRRQQTELW